jgi:zinc finger BED domain-containing protein 1 (E3 SUMO-protein ligase ZBED1)
LLWWKKKEEALYPYIAKLAKKLLCIPATSAPAERLFSHAGLGIAKARTALLPENAFVIVFQHDSWETAEAYEANRA